MTSPYTVKLKEDKTASALTEQHRLLCAQRCPRRAGHKPGPPCPRRAATHPGPGASALLPGAGTEETVLQRAPFAATGAHPGGKPASLQQKPASRPACLCFTNIKPCSGSPSCPCPSPAAGCCSQLTLLPSARTSHPVSAMLGPGAARSPRRTHHHAPFRVPPSPLAPRRLPDLAAPSPPTLCISFFTPTI